MARIEGEARWVESATLDKARDSDMFVSCRCRWRRFVSAQECGVRRVKQASRYVVRWPCGLPDDCGCKWNEREWKGEKVTNGQVKKRGKKKQILGDHERGKNK